MEHNRGVDEKTWIKAGDFEKGEHTPRSSERVNEHTAYNYARSLSSREMESLVALCDTLLPSITISKDHIADDALVKFYDTSASMIEIPNKVAMMLMKTEHPKHILLRFTLWLLSTTIGTLILCGKPSLSNHFPYVQKFSRISCNKREEIFVAWSLSYFLLLRMFFRAIKFIISLAFFTQVNEKNENPSWKAIDYCGPDPDFNKQIQPNMNIKNFFGPVYKGVVFMNKPRRMVVEALKRSRLAISVPHDHPTRSYKNPSMIIKCDAVVVGSGSGGGVVAGVLAKSGYKVLVLEKGKFRARSNLSLLEGPSMEEMYLGKGLLATSDMEAVILAGSTVGGGSAINWSACIRTPEHVLKEWSESYDLELFESRLYEEAMNVVCERMGVQSEVEDEGFNNMVLRKGCEELGYPVKNIPRNSPPDHYCGWCCLGCKDGRKKGTSETWLVDLVESGNGTILPACEALKVVHYQKKGRDRRTAKGVIFEFLNQEGSREICVVESKVTIVSCGALCTPQLLKRSGLKNPNIGKNLHIHPVAMAWGHFPLERWPEVEKKSYEGGIMTAMSTVVADFRGSGYGSIIQTPSLHPGMFSALIPWVSGSDFKTRMSKFSRTAHVFALARDKGSGELRPKTSISYQMDVSDEENLKRGLEKSLRILAAAGAEEIGTHNNKGRTINVKTASYHEFERFVREESSRALGDLSTPMCSAHQMGSCRMGVEAKGSAVNPMGETWEVEGLYVADTSVFPTALGVNPMVTVQAIAYCTAQSALASLKRMKDIVYHM